MNVNIHHFHKTLKTGDKKRAELLYKILGEAVMNLEAFKRACTNDNHEMARWIFYRCLAKGEKISFKDLISKSFDNIGDNFIMSAIKISSEGGVLLGMEEIFHKACSSNRQNLAKRLYKYGLENGARIPIRFCCLWNALSNRQLLEWLQSLENIVIPENYQKILFEQMCYKNCSIDTIKIFYENYRDKDALLLINWVYKRQDIAAWLYNQGYTTNNEWFYKEKIYKILEEESGLKRVDLNVLRLVVAYI